MKTGRCFLLIAVMLTAGALAGTAGAQNFPVRPVRLVVPFAAGGNVSEAAPFVAQGRLRPIAVTSLTRSEVMKDVPTLHESGLTGYEVINWFGALTRSSAPPAASERMSAEFARALEVQEVKERLAALGLSAATLRVGEFNAFLKAEMQSNEKIVRAANIRM